MAERGPNGGRHMRLNNRLRRLEARASIDGSSLSAIEQSWMLTAIQPLLARCRYRAGACDAAEVTKVEAEVKAFRRRYAAEIAIIDARPVPPNPEFDALVANI